MLPKPLFKDWSRVCVLLVVIKHIGYNQCLFSTSFCTLVFCEINVVLFQLWSGLFLQSLFTLSQGWSLLEWILYIQTILQEYGQGAGNTTQVCIFKLHPKKFPRFDSAQFCCSCKKRLSLFSSLVDHWAGVYPSFLSVKQLEVLLLSPGWHASPWQGYPPPPCIPSSFLDNWAGPIYNPEWREAPRDLRVFPRTQRHYPAKFRTQISRPDTLMP